MPQLAARVGIIDIANETIQKPENIVHFQIIFLPVLLRQKRVAQHALLVFQHIHPFSRCVVEITVNIGAIL